MRPRQGMRGRQLTQSSPMRYPPLFRAEKSGDRMRPITLRTPTLDILCNDAKRAHGLAWQLYAQDLTEIPPTCPGELARALCELIGSQREAARRLHVDPRTVRRWARIDVGVEAGEKWDGPPWAAMELLRRMLPKAGRIIPAD